MSRHRQAIRLANAQRPQGHHELALSGMSISNAELDRRLAMRIIGKAKLYDSKIFHWIYVRPVFENC